MSVRRAVTLALVAGCLGGCAMLGVYRPGTDDAPEVVTVALTDASVDVRPILVGGGKVRLEIVNDGQLEHGIHIVGPGTAEESDDFLMPGQRKRMSLKLAPGVFRIFCPDGDHAARGMSGRLVVEESVGWFRR